MRALIGEWITNLAIISILAALVDMVLPNGNLRKYTSFLFGLVILVMFLQPLLQLIGQGPKLQYEIFQNSFNQQSRAAAWQKELIEKNQQQRLEQMMQDNLEKELALDLKYRTDFDNLKVVISFGQKNGEIDFSIIQRVDVTTQTNPNSSIVETVSIKIGESLNENKENKDEDNSASTDMELDLKEYISNLYNIEPSLIYINGR